MAKTQKESRRKVCVVCYSKATQSLSSNEIDIKQKYLIDGFEVCLCPLPHYSVPEKEESKFQNT